MQTVPCLLLFQHAAIGRKVHAARHMASPASLFVKDVAALSSDIGRSIHWRVLWSGPVITSVVVPDEELTV